MIKYPSPGNKEHRELSAQKENDEFLNWDSLHSKSQWFDLNIVKCHFKLKQGKVGLTRKITAWGCYCLKFNSSSYASTQCSCMVLNRLNCSSLSMICLVSLPKCREQPTLPPTSGRDRWLKQQWQSFAAKRKWHLQESMKGKKMKMLLNLTHSSTKAFFFLTFSLKTESCSSPKTSAFSTKSPENTSIVAGSPSSELSVSRFVLELPHVGVLWQFSSVNMHSLMLHW